MAKPLPVAVEVGAKKAFAWAVDWSGWCRTGANEQAALAALAEYAPRYRVVAQRAGIPFPNTARTLAGASVLVEERLPGGATTDFGAPEKTGEADRRPTTPAGAKRLAAIVSAAWAVFDEVAAASPPQLRKGPRGGGRDRDAMIDHVLSAETAYAHKLGIRLKPPAIDDVGAIEAQREAIAAVLCAPSDGTPLVERGWTTRYAARRIAWHVLDHAWEMQDRADPGP
jgi:hypothetical protein